MISWGGHHCHESGVQAFCHTWGETYPSPRTALLSCTQAHSVCKWQSWCIHEYPSALCRCSIAGTWLQRETRWGMSEVSEPSAEDGPETVHCIRGWHLRYCPTHAGCIMKHKAQVTSHTLAARSGPSWPLCPHIGSQVTSVHRSSVLSAPGGSPRVHKFASRRTATAATI